MCVNGVLVNPSTHQLVQCTTCQGEGEIDPDAICACGRHATFRKDGHLYCGRAACLELLKDDARMDAVHARYSSGYSTGFRYGDDAWWEGGV